MPKEWTSENLRESKPQAPTVCQALCQALSYLLVMSPLQCPREVDESGESCFSGGKIEFQVCKGPMFGGAGIETQVCLTPKTGIHSSELLCPLIVLSVVGLFFATGM